MLADIEATVAKRPTSGVIPAAAGCACHGVNQGGRASPA
jgi:hypothetical protein